MNETPTPRTDEQVNGKPCTRFAIMAGDSLRDAMVPSEFARQLEREIVDARKERDKWAYECGANMKLLKEAIATGTRAIEQRDTLAEALRQVRAICLDKSIETHPDEHAKGTIDDCIDIAESALAAVKGGTP
jgi:hypothetical protein